MSEPAVDDLPITVQLSLWRWRLVIGNLQRGIFAEVAPLISAIAAQAEQQLAVAAAAQQAKLIEEARNLAAEAAAQLPRAEASQPVKVH
jgi:hypothetical protein